MSSCGGDACPLGVTGIEEKPNRHFMLISDNYSKKLNMLNFICRPDVYNSNRYSGNKSTTLTEWMMVSLLTKGCLCVCVGVCGCACADMHPGVCTLSLKYCACVTQAAFTT